MMFVVLAYRNDVAARVLVQRWLAAGERAALLTCEDLSRPGWRYVAGRRGDGRAFVEGRLIPTRAIRAVITRMPAVGEAELAYVHEDDRRYAVAEMQAFLLAWLSSLECPVLNRPSPSNLAGPSWNGPEWVQRARRLGFAATKVKQRAEFVAGATLDVPRPTDECQIVIDVIGDRAFLPGGHEPGAGDASRAEAAVMLARDAGVELLRVCFARGDEQTPTFLEAGFWVDVAAERVAEAIADRCRDLSGEPVTSSAAQSAAGTMVTA
ncbi:MAG TPA: hypothetical protein VKB50_20595 [Vicinamibacterales bacterium]|nr:hypothetical protein [Vicinamibacterales bacterium]